MGMQVVYMEACIPCRDSSWRVMCFRVFSCLFLFLPIHTSRVPLTSLVYPTHTSRSHTHARDNPDDVHVSDVIYMVGMLDMHTEA